MDTAVVFKRYSSLAIALGLAALLLDSETGAATRETVTDFYGAPIGTIKKDGDRSEVSDFYGAPLGSADRNGTRDFLGRPISPNNVPGLLFSPEHNPMLKEKQIEIQKEQRARDKDLQEALEWRRQRDEEEARAAREGQERRESEFAAAQRGASERLRKPLSYRMPGTALKTKQQDGIKTQIVKVEQQTENQNIWFRIKSAWARYLTVTSSAPPNAGATEQRAARKAP